MRPTEGTEEMMESEMGSVETEEIEEVGSDNGVPDGDSGVGEGASAGDGEL